MDNSALVTVKIETAIRNQSWATAEVGQKSLQTLVVDFKARKITGSYITGTTRLLGMTLKSVRDDFQLTNVTFNAQGNVSFSVKGQTASGVRFMPNIDYKFDILLTSSPKTITVTGSHDGYPSYNVSVNGKPVYDYVQGFIGQLLGDSDVKVELVRKSVDWN